MNRKMPFWIVCIGSELAPRWTYAFSTWKMSETGVVLKAHTTANLLLNTGHTRQIAALSHRMKDRSSSNELVPGTYAHPNARAYVLMRMVGKQERENGRERSSASLGSLCCCGE